MMVYICTKFHENILNSIRVMEWTEKVNGRTDGRMDRGHDIIQPVFFIMKVCCVFSLELPQLGDSNEYTQYTSFNIKKENRSKLSQIRSYGIFPRDSRTSLKQPW